VETLQHLLTRCLGELREWRAGHPDVAREVGRDVGRDDGRAAAPDAVRYPEEFYARVERALRQLRRIRDAEEAARLVRELELRIRDEGPLSEQFLPSLEDLHEAVTRADA